MLKPPQQHQASWAELSVSAQGQAGQVAVFTLQSTCTVTGFWRVLHYWWFLYISSTGNVKKSDPHSLGLWHIIYLDHLSSRRPGVAGNHLISGLMKPGRITHKWAVDPCEWEGISEINWTLWQFVNNNETPDNPASQCLQELKIITFPLNIGGLKYFWA